jgi:hypothetical protein
VCLRKQDNYAGADIFIAAEEPSERKYAYTASESGEEERGLDLMEGREEKSDRRLENPDLLQGLMEGLVEGLRSQLKRIQQGSRAN